MRGAKRVRLKFADFVVDVFTAAGCPPDDDDELEDAEPTVGPQDARTDDGAQCLLDIVATLAEGRRRLTTTKLLAAMGARGCVWGDSTVKRRLAAAVAAGQITNDLDADPPGYGLPCWQNRPL